MSNYSIPKDLVAEYSAACQIVSLYEELRAHGPVDPDKLAWAGQELETKTLIERIAILESAVSDEEWDAANPGTSDGETRWRTNVNTLINNRIRCGTALRASSRVQVPTNRL